MIQYLIAMSLIATLSAAAPEDESAASSARVHITLVNCVGNYGHESRPRLLVLDNSSERVIKEQELPAQSYSLIREWDIALPEGFDRFVIGDGPCTDSLLVPVLSGHDRHILAIARNQGILRTSSAMVAGVTPFRGYSAKIVFDPLTVRGAKPNALIEYRAVVAGNAFYAVGLPAGSAKLEIENSNALPGTSLQFSIGVVSKSGPRSRIVVNITPIDIAQAVSKQTF